MSMTGVESVDRALGTSQIAAFVGFAYAFALCAFARATSSNLCGNLRGTRPYPCRLGTPDLQSSTLTHRSCDHSSHLCSSRRNVVAHDAKGFGKSADVAAYAPSGAAGEEASKFGPPNSLSALLEQGNHKAGVKTAEQPSPPPRTVLQHLANSPLVGVLALRQEALAEHESVIRAVAEFCAWLLWFYLCDRTSLLPFEAKAYSRDTVATIFAALVFAAFAGSVKADAKAASLSRHQTEEWKGWMQVAFLLYHYFAAAEVYNGVRVLIAAYVFLTGYGNFHYYHRTGDYCVGRFAQMMWRLNFLTAACCAVLRNSYMLYYVTGMHTLFTVLVYATLAVGRRWNGSPWGIAGKLTAAALLVALMWDVPGVFHAIWRPFTALVGYQNPRYVWIVGMLLAWLHPHYESCLKAIECLSAPRRLTVRIAIVAVCAVAGHVWFTRVYTLPKLEYNRLHPFTSWVPLTIWMALRNLTPALRSHYLGLFAWLGCVTLETYIGQFHIWLRSNIPDGQPTWTLAVIPRYPLANFLVTSVLYIGVSRRLFVLTNVLKSAWIPHSDDAALLRNLLSMAALGAVLFAAASALQSVLTMSALCSPTAV